MALGQLTVWYSDAPYMERFDDIMGEQVGGHDTWITEEPLYVECDFPAIPPVYAQEQQDKRALYIKGIPAIWQNEAFKALMASCGRVENCPVFISLASENTFRWVIMSTAEEAEMLLARLQHFVFQGNSLTTSLARAPGLTMHAIRSPTPAQTPEQPTPPPPARGVGASTVHGHPSPNSKAKAVEKTKENIKAVTERSPSPVTQVNAVAIPKEFTPSSSTAASTAPIISTTTAATTATTTPAVPTAQAAEGAQAPNTTPESFIPVATSWASIASAANPSTSVVDLHPQNRTVSGGHRLQPIGRIPTVVRTEGESQADQMRVVFLLNLPNTITLQDVSNGVKEGPLVRIQFGYDEDTKARFSGVVFQYAKDAAAFHSVLLKEKLESKPNRFRFVVESVRGDAFAPDDTIRAMFDPTIGATRRLTMVKKGFFFTTNERQLTGLCHKVVGEEKVQLVWLYNGGNATIVFSDVAASIKMKAEIDRWIAAAELPGKDRRWAGLQVTYSKDPCLVPLEFKTALTS
jgi:hypothetical protein